MIWRCPKCAQALREADRSLVCDSNHCYDRARQGYCYLLLANQKNSLHPGDSDDMILARRDFLRAGFYQPLVDKLCTIFQQRLAAKNAEPKLLDLGCGEGYYLESLAQYIRGCGAGMRPYFYGVDISKDAVKRAATSAKVLLRDYDNVQYFDYAVASNHHLPVANKAVNACLNVFAPIDNEEVKRVLQTNGFLVRVQPGPRHLYQIKTLLYDNVRLHELAASEPGFNLAERHSVAFRVVLPDARAIAQLLSMTPLNWHGDREEKQKLLEKTSLEVEVDFDVQVLELASGPKEIGG